MPTPFFSKLFSAKCYSVIGFAYTRKKNLAIGLMALGNYRCTKCGVKK
jgi:hypothetical protein